MTSRTNTSVLKTPVVSSELHQEHLDYGKMKVKYNVSELKEDIEDTSRVVFISTHNNNLNSQKKTESATVEYQPPRKKKIYKDKLPSSNTNILLTELSLIQDQALTSKEKDLTPFWTSQSEDLSKKLWLPTEIDCVDSVLTSSSASSTTIPTEKSWFSINIKRPQKQNSQRISSLSSLFSLQDSMVSGVTASTKKSKNSKSTGNLKTLKIRLLPTKEQAFQIKTTIEQFRWYYNSILSIWNKEYPAGTEFRQIISYKVEKWLREYDYVETNVDDVIMIEYVKRDHGGNNDIFKPEWWTGEKQLHSRVPRGAAYKFTQNINSAIANKMNNNIRDFKLKPLIKKADLHYALFTDKNFPKFITKIKSVYAFTTKDRKHRSLSFNQILEQQLKNKENHRGCEIQYDSVTNRYYLYYPVDSSFYPEGDRRIENQNKYCTSKDEIRLISLDPGVRKFMVGYDPGGKMIFVGEGASTVLLDKLLISDKTQYSNEKKRQYRNIKNKVDDLHWKTISFLMQNYDVILLPEYNTSQMLKGKKLNRKVKRMMSMFSNYKFKQRLIWKCSLYNKRILIVDESYTSKTCTLCGCLNMVGGNEVYRCNKCNLTVDRDCNGARNILIKNKDNVQFTCNV